MMLLGYFLLILLDVVRPVQCYSSLSPQSKITLAGASANHFQDPPTKNLNPLLVTRNVTQLLIERFNYLFKSPYNQDGTNSIVGDVVKSVAQQFDIVSSTPFDSSNFTSHQSTLETRKIHIEHQPTIESNDVVQSESEESLRNYFRIYDKVFSRVALPEIYGSKTSKSKGSYCGPFIGCIEELPNFPALLRKTNISTVFSIYTSSNPKHGHRIPYEPLIHYQLQDTRINETELSQKLYNLNQQPHNHNYNHRSNGKQHRNTAASWRSAVEIAHSHEYPFDLASIEASGFNASANTRIIIGGYFAKADEEWIDEVIRQWMILEPKGNAIKVSWPDANRGLYHTAAYNSRIVGRQLSLFLHYLDQIFHVDLDKFHLVGHSLGAHIAGLVGADNDGKIARITGLDPAGPIFFELNTGMRLDPTDAKFVDVMHTNGGTLTKGSLGLSLPVGHVDYYCNGGSIQPGCYFASMTKSIMDPVERIACNHRRSYRYFIEIIKMTIKANGPQDSNTPDTNSIQPILQLVDPNEQGDEDRVSFREDPDEVSGGGDKCSKEGCDMRNSVLTYLPSAFLFEAQPEELGAMAQPQELVLLTRDSSEFDLTPPPRRHIEFHLMNPDFPTDKRGTYFFRSRSESPYFSTKQYALTMKTDVSIRRKIAISAKINTTVIAEAEIDEIPGSYSLIFAPNDMKLMQPYGDSNSPPQLQLMWRYRSFNLLLNQQNELHLSGLELSLLEAPASHARSLRPAKLYEPPVPIARYITGQLDGTTGVSSLTGGGGSNRILLKGGFSGHLTLTRNQWHRFEGKPVRNR